MVTPFEVVAGIVVAMVVAVYVVTYVLILVEAATTEDPRFRATDVKQ